MILARVTGVSRYSVIRSVYAAIGLTPHAYLLQLRVEAARQMISRRVSLAHSIADRFRLSGPYVARTQATLGYTRLPPAVELGGRPLESPPSTD